MPLLNNRILGAGASLFLTGSLVFPLGCKGSDPEDIVPNKYPISAIVEHDESMTKPMDDYLNSKGLDLPDQDGGNGLKPYLGGLASIDEDGWIHPNDIDFDGKGNPKYDLGDIEHAILARVEATDNKDIKLFTKLSWRAYANTFEQASDMISSAFEKNYTSVGKYKIESITPEDNQARIKVRTKDSDDPSEIILEKFDGEWHFV